MAATDTAGIRRDPSFIEIIRDLRDDALTLVRQEVALAKREMGVKATRIGRNAVFLGAGALTGFFGLFFVLLALNNLLFAGLAKAGFSGTVANWMSPALLGMLILIVGLSFTLAALRSMRRSLHLPDRTMESLRDDRDWLKEKLR